MAKKLYEESNIQAIADAIRGKNGTTYTYKVSEMASAIGEIESGGGSGINPEWTDWRYFSYYNNRNDLVEKLKFSDTSKGTFFSNMFYYCSNLTAIPKIDTSNCTNFSNMFTMCSKLTTVPEIDTSKGTIFSNMFDNCAKLTTVPKVNTSNGTDFSYMFRGCKVLTTVPEMDTSNGTNFNYMFSGCNTLTTIPKMDTTKGTMLDNLFMDCHALENITFTGTFKIKKNLSVFSYSNNLTVDSLMSFINALSDNSSLSTTYTVTIGSTNLAKLTEEQIAIATNKNIILA